MKRAKGKALAVVKTVKRIWAGLPGDRHTKMEIFDRMLQRVDWSRWTDADTTAVLEFVLARASSSDVREVEKVARHEERWMKGYLVERAVEAKLESMGIQPSWDLVVQVAEFQLGRKAT